MTLALLAYLALVIWAWSPSVPEFTADGRKIITFWHSYNDSEEKVLTEIIDKWEALPENASYTIRAVRIPFSGHQTKIRTALTVGKAPAMARVDWSFVYELATKNALVSLNDYGFDKIKDDYLQAPLNSCLVNGKYYGVPDQSNCVVMFYNRKLFKEAGLIPEKSQFTYEEAKNIMPKTWDGFKKLAKSLTKTGSSTDGDVYGYAMTNTLWWSLPILNTYGVSVISPDGKKCTYDSPEGIAAVNMLKSFVTEGIEASAWRSGATPTDTGFVNNKYAMILSGPWNLQQFRNSRLDFGVALIPGGSEGTSSNIGGTDVVIFNHVPADVAEASYRFFVFLTNKDNQVLWCKKLDQLPVNVNAHAEVNFEDPYLKIFNEQMGYTKPNPLVKDFALLEDIINPEIETVFSNQKTTENALKSIRERVEAELLTEMLP